MSIEVAGATHVGLVRNNNEDNLLMQRLEEDLVLALVSDGVGGHNAGEVASAHVVDGFSALVEAGKLRPAARAEVRGPLLEMATQKVHVHISEDAVGTPDRAGMAATLTSVIADTESGTLLQVGDSRCYRWRKGVLDQLSEDQTVAMELLLDGRISREELATHPDRNVLSQCLGLEGLGTPLKPQVAEFDWSPGDVLLLCSDGLTDLVDDLEIAELIGAADVLEDGVKTLIQAALDGGGKDNVTIVLLRNAGDDDDETLRSSGEETNVP